MKNPLEGLADKLDDRLDHDLTLKQRLISGGLELLAGTLAAAFAAWAYRRTLDEDEPEAEPEESEDS